MQRRRCYISYKKEDIEYKKEIVKIFGDVDFIDGSQQKPINSNNPDFVMQEIRRKYLQNTTVTIFLIGEYSGENYRDPIDKFYDIDSQIYIRREVTATLYDRKGDPRHGLLGVVLPTMYDKIYKGTYICDCCGVTVNNVNISNETVIKEFVQNFYIKKDKNNGCDHYSDDEMYAVLVKYSDFMKDPDKYIEQAYQKRTQPIANKVRVKNFD